MTVSSQLVTLMELVAVLALVVVVAVVALMALVALLDLVGLVALMDVMVLVSLYNSSFSFSPSSSVLLFANQLFGINTWWHWSCSSSISGLLF